VKIRGLPRFSHKRHAPDWDHQIDQPHDWCSHDNICAIEAKGQVFRLNAALKGRCRGSGFGRRRGPREVRTPARLLASKAALNLIHCAGMDLRQLAPDFFKER